MTIPKGIGDIGTVTVVIGTKPGQSSRIRAMRAFIIVVPCVLISAQPAMADLLKCVNGVGAIAISNVQCPEGYSIATSEADIVRVAAPQDRALEQMRAQSDDRARRMVRDQLELSRPPNLDGLQTLAADLDLVRDLIRRRDTASTEGSLATARKINDEILRFLKRSITMADSEFQALAARVPGTMQTSVVTASSDLARAWRAAQQAQGRQIEALSNLGSLRDQEEDLAKTVDDIGDEIRFKQIELKTIQEATRDFNPASLRNSTDDQIKMIRKGRVLEVEIAQLQKKQNHALIQQKNKAAEIQAEAGATSRDLEQIGNLRDKLKTMWEEAAAFGGAR